MVRINITFDHETLRLADREARRLRTSRSEFIRAAVRSEATRNDAAGKEQELRQQRREAIEGIRKIAKEAGFQPHFLCARKARRFLLVTDHHGDFSRNLARLHVARNGLKVRTPTGKKDSQSFHGSHPPRNSCLSIAKAHAGKIKNAPTSISGRTFLGRQFLAGGTARPSRNHARRGEQRSPLAERRSALRSGRKFSLRKQDFTALYYRHSCLCPGLMHPMQPTTTGRCGCATQPVVAPCI